MQIKKRFVTIGTHYVRISIHNFLLLNQNIYNTIQIILKTNSFLIIKLLEKDIDYYTYTNFLVAREIAIYDYNI